MISLVLLTMLPLPNQAPKPHTARSTDWQLGIEPWLCWRNHAIVDAVSHILSMIVASPILLKVSSSSLGLSFLEQRDSRNLHRCDHGPSFTFIFLPRILILY